ncbi:site-specific integrase [Jatrophihabitans telluris]|uniref:Site-specific integrase n=1 Tax=Jatrophihabitans telluris TaxID=2038343 RepID=A0ABY4QVM0_9ACTN|nr:site-specific integrase [Jatrophihabitans telluris]UQX87081.1 site-specific integrase [Jatrophihabitans telluris]
MPTKKRGKPFGSVRKLPSGRYQARYHGPDGIRYTAPLTFDTTGDADAWLSAMRTDMSRGTWKPAGSNRPLTFGEYADTWLQERNLRPRTHQHYAELLTKQLRPTFGTMGIRDISPDLVRRWFSTTATTTPTLRAHAYALLRTICNTAVADDVIAANPCRIRGAGQAKRARRIKPATLDELARLVDAMPERYRLMTLLAAWTQLRFGELAELRRSDIDLKNGIIHVQRGVVRVDGALIVGRPKSEAGVRDVAIPPHLMPLVRSHLSKHITGGRNGLLFTSRTGAQIVPTTLYKVYYPARTAAGRPDLRWHDLRHTGAVLAASTGATLAELMARLGHSTPGAALRYQHAADGRDLEIAAALSALAASSTVATRPT